VVLIDEYDAPLNKHIGPAKRDQFDDVRENFIKPVFEELSSLDEHILFCFVTGISAIGKSAIWSVADQWADRSSDAELAAMCGFTYEETKAVLRDAGFVRPDELDAFFNTFVHGYGGYRCNYKGEPVKLFNPCVVRRVVQQRDIVNQWESTVSGSVLKHMQGQVVPPVPIYIESTALLAGDESPELDSEVKLAKMLFRAGLLTMGDVCGDIVRLDHVNPETAETLLKRIPAWSAYA